jgi:hypothetical protein
MPPCSTAIYLSAADAISAVLAVNGRYKCCLFLLPIIQLERVFLSRALAVTNASSSCHVWNLQILLVIGTLSTTNDGTGML